MKFGTDVTWGSAFGSRSFTPAHTTWGFDPTREQRRVIATLMKEKEARGSHGQLCRSYAAGDLVSDAWAERFES